ncbi:MAG: hypothetical protein IPN72_23210 [Saprospiraceae bacterium]|nr:hypothetical protein [Saprospiraceae bacterium]
MKDFKKGIKRCELDINVTFEFLTDNREKDTTCKANKANEGQNFSRLRI